MSVNIILGKKWKGAARYGIVGMGGRGFRDLKIGCIPVTVAKKVANIEKQHK
jgi:hypothetical protein